MYKNLILLLLPLSVHALEVLPKKVPVPADNPITPAKIELGRQLYHDARLSLDNTVSCNSCHNVIGKNSGGVDNKPTSAGVKGQLGGRNSPTVLNAAFMSVQFWDGRAISLEDQAKGPLTNPIEMSMPTHDMVIERISKLPGYVEQFKKVFGTDKITIDHVAKAIATYERTLITPKSQVDQYVAGNKRALSSSAIRGLKLVESVGCLSCHSGPNYAGPAMPLGTGFYQKFPLIPNAEYEAKYGFSKDLGRYEVTKSETDKNLFRVPTWRNIALTAPYFHNGKVETLDEAVKVMAKTQLNRDLKDQEVKDIVAFLNGLTGKRKAETMPKLPQ